MLIILQIEAFFSYNFDMLNIIGGELKHRQIRTPKGTRTRPTSSLVRKAVFDISQFEIEGTDFLDLYAGSGAMGIEALSRGARSATFVDSDRFAADCIVQNLKDLDLKAEVLRLDAIKAVHHLEKKNCKFHFIYVDPPYAHEVMPLLEALDQSKLLQPNGKLFLEQRVGAKINKEALLNLKLDSERKFGDTILFIFTD